MGRSARRRSKEGSRCGSKHSKTIPRRPEGVNSKSSPPDGGFARRALAAWPNPGTPPATPSLRKKGAGPAVKAGTWTHVAAVVEEGAVSCGVALAADGTSQ